MIYPEITQFIQSLSTSQITDDRKDLLKPLISYIQDKIDKKEEIRLNFICTHNSRRSHLSQVWAQVMAAHFNITNVFSYSGGTEATALYPMAAQALTKSGLKITALSENINPVYSIKYADNAHPVIGFSKTFDDTFNPKKDFGAIMTCSNADQGCPFIPGAEKRFPITYEDPKAFDNTPQQENMYVERSTQIATEMLFVFSSLSVNE